ncbi:AGE family epimerase/isomerase [Phycicoccus sp. Soil803]|uniref:AGE family epimerase/isomerase n=1 Tax=Phycicoccus sp. Soil803 TaxID=1736415 RepID=UPI00070B11DE|nr:AGE family epimerase/isomerase [Phycicoccus sp. Soil803]KRF26524.1 N-acyl-D-glucosamine 2-epimerase [Phycicoccus sp. Soil803]
MSETITIGPDTAWLRQHRTHLRRFASASKHPTGGFGWLDDHGALRPHHNVELWITCRMTHVFALGHLELDHEATRLLDHGMHALRHTLFDRNHDGWFAAVNEDGPANASKEAYGHAFVILAASAAVAAGHPDADYMLEHALDVHDEKFWHFPDALAVDVWDRDWSTLEPYRGVNANMHTVEALLAAGDVTGDREWIDRAARIVERVVHNFATENAYRLPEHFDTDWNALPQYNEDNPAHPFRPYGVTIGHLFEWARLSLHVRTALGSNAPAWLVDDAAALFARAEHDGWAVDGHPGFVYTTDFEGRPIVRQRMHWVVTEAIAAAWAMFAATSDPRYADLHSRWWAHAMELFIEPDGSWRHELSPQNTPSHSVWQGKPDVYHAYQAALLPVLTDVVSFAGATRRNEWEER